MLFGITYDGNGLEVWSKWDKRVNCVWKFVFTPRRAKLYLISNAATWQILS